MVILPPNYYYYYKTHPVFLLPTRTPGPCPGPSREQLLHHLHHGVDLGLDAEELLADGAFQQHAHHVVELAQLREERGRGAKGQRAEQMAEGQRGLGVEGVEK